MKQDPVKFINDNLHNITTFLDTTKEVKLYKEQEEIVNTIVSGNNTIIKAPRRSGKSLCIKSCIVYQLLFSKVKIRLVTTSNSLLKHHFSSIKIALLKLNVEVKEKNNTLYLDNGSSFTINRDFDVDVLYLDEFAFYPLKKVKQDYYDTIFKAHKHHQKKVQVIIASTPSSNTNTMTELGYFFKSIYNGALENKNTFTPVPISFKDVPYFSEEVTELQYAL